MTIHETTNFRMETEMVHSELRIAATYRWMAQWPEVQRGREDYRNRARLHVTLAREWRIKRNLRMTEGR